MKIYLLIGIPNSIFITPHTDFHIVAIMMFTNLSHNRVSLLLKILQQFPISIQSKIQSSYYGLQGLLEAPATSLTSSPLPFLPAYHPPNSPTSQLISKRPDVHSGVFALKVLSDYHLFPQENTHPSLLQVSAPVSVPPSQCSSLVPHPTLLFCKALIT